MRSAPGTSHAGTRPCPAGGRRRAASRLHSCQSRCTAGPSRAALLLTAGPMSVVSSSPLPTRSFFVRSTSDRRTSGKSPSAGSCGWWPCSAGRWCRMPPTERLRGKIEVGVVEHDHRVLAAQFQRAVLEALGAGFCPRCGPPPWNPSAIPRARPGCSIIGVPTRRAKTGDQVHHAMRERPHPSESARN